MKSIKIDYEIKNYRKALINFLLLFFLTFLWGCVKKEKDIENYFITSHVVSEHSVLGTKYEIVKDSFFAKNEMEAKKRALSYILSRQAIYDDMELERKMSKKIDTYVVVHKNGKELNIKNLPKIIKDSIVQKVLLDVGKSKN